MSKPSLRRKSAADISAVRRAQAKADQNAFRMREHTSLWARPGFLVRRLHQIHVSMFMEVLEEYGMTPVQYGLMSILVDMPGLDQFSVAEELGIDRANVHDVLKRLESRKLVARVVDPHNRRRKLCLASREGAELVARIYPRMQEAQKRLLAPLDEGERAMFMQLLHDLVEANNVYGRTALRPQGQRLSGSNADSKQLV